jgi:cyclopropane-fatty-acyl-phospholipid synthase
MSDRLHAFLTETFADFPWEIVISDWTGRRYSLGRGQRHWRGTPLEVGVGNEASARDLISLNPVRFLERFVRSECDLSGNLHLLGEIRDYARMSLSPWRAAWRTLANRAFQFQNAERARVSVKSHYDIPQAALDLYLDREYLSYSCAMFEEPGRLDAGELVRIGSGRTDDFDSLEKAQWRKFQDAADYVAPAAGECVLDIGCGYGGQLRVLLESYPRSKVVGWTHSRNQVLVGRDKLASQESSMWELHEGDYRQETRVFDHVTSTGMISHVGPRGLAPYVRNIRRRIVNGGRYLHHALMTPYIDRALDTEVGVAFNKKYVWPGFHWFTLGAHVRALECNGFEVARLTNLSAHYAKTTAAWYERMMLHQERFRDSAGDGTLRAWQAYLGPLSTAFLKGRLHVYRLYCRAV